ncbi:uncharacterized protein LOC104585204 isoform X2 [Brachypodium distachyon]|uniref:uncharacterized protein LOC104585204 isoform X2 n=1 Tax=Brachypodium distachyon TaxID=15368 RepID=UPI0001C717A4|nr:uncharacterized protein LOC104585204 isoform X2 [Brachypodium distachyon]|eukprot:XP_010239533.2 uncharacterized protein LOC104585204 isoform X2 [Brachypodium distachyon]
MATGEHMMSDRLLGPRYLHSLGKLVMSDRLLGLLIAGGTIISARDNFMVSSDDDAKIYRERVTGSAEVFFSFLHFAVKSYELIPKERLPVRLLTLPIKFPHNLRIYRDTAFIVFISYMLLLDIDLSYFWLATFPAIPIVGMSAHCIKLYLAGELGTHNGSKMMTFTKGSDMALTVMASVPFIALLGMAQLDDKRADRFVISPFLLFLSTTLGALTHMMTRLPSRAGSPGPGAWELLHKTFLLLLLVTLHTVAAEALGEDVVLVCMPELVPVVMWFSLHLDRDSSIISLDNMRRTFKDAPIVRGAVVIAGPLLVYLWTYMDRWWISTCSAILVSCGISGLLTSNLVLMLHQWPMQQAAAADISLQSKKSSEEDVQSEEEAVDSSEEAVRSEEEAVGSLEEQAAGSSEKAVRSGEQADGSSEAVQLLELWAILLLTVAVASLLLKCAIAYRLGLQEPLADTCALPKFSMDVLGNLFGKWGQTN